MSPWDWVICFSTSDGEKGLNYYQTYTEIENIFDQFPFLGLESIKNLSVRERKYWYKKAKVKAERQSNGN
jgi:hypothetical protein